jgi:hypothetical protein
MKPTILLKQALRKIHTSAICDSGCQTSETRANAGFARSTARNKAVHTCGLLHSSPSVCAAFGMGSQR